MKHALLTATALGCVITSLMTLPAQAGNSTVEKALQARPDLSSFYQGLVSTGVINELKEGQPYTVFAPTNEAFAKLSPAEYPCFYSQQCRAQVAQVLRHHIVPGEKHLADIGARGGVMSMFTIDNYHIIGSEPARDSYAVDGTNVLSENQLAGGILYRVDAVITNKREMAQFTTPAVLMVHAQGTDLPPRVPAGTIVTITQTP